MEELVIVPVNPAGGREFDVCERPERAVVDGDGVDALVLDRSFTLSKNALRYASMTVPIEGAMASKSRCSVYRIETFRRPIESVFTARMFPGAQWLDFFPAASTSVPFLSRRPM